MTVAPTQFLPILGIFTILYKKSCNAFWPNCVYSCGPVVAAERSQAQGESSRHVSHRPRSLLKLTSNFFRRRLGREAHRLADRNGQLFPTRNLAAGHLHLVQPI